jgi:uncharacterized protein YycO
MGNAIKWFTQGKIGHVDAICDGGLLLGSQEAKNLGGKPSGVQIRPQEYGNLRNKIIVHLDVTEEQHGIFWKFLLAQIGKPYDIYAIAGFIFNRDWQKDDAWFCSELIAAALQEAKIVKRLMAPNNKITPQELLLICSAIVDIDNNSN